MAYTIIIDGDRNRRMALDAVRKARLGQQVKISKPMRTLEQNARCHAMLTDIADQLPWPKGDGATHVGEMHDVEWWKRTCTLGWLIDINEHPKVIKSPDGKQVAILLPHTSDLDVSEAASLNQWIETFAVQEGVTLKEPNGPEPPPPDPKDYR